MTTSAGFDPVHFFDFDLASGAVHTRNGQRVLVVSDDVLGPLVAAAVSAQDLTPVRSLGQKLGQTVREELGADPVHSAPHEVLTHVAGVVGAFGWGRLGVERWGKALVVSVESLPEIDAQHLAIAALLGGLFSSLVSEEVACVPVGKEGIFLVVNPNVAAQVWAWSRQEAGLAPILARLGPSDGAESPV